MCVRQVLTCESGLENHFSSNPACRSRDVSARKFQMPLKSFTSLLSDSLGYNIPGREDSILDTLSKSRDTRTWNAKAVTHPAILFLRLVTQDLNVTHYTGVDCYFR